MQRQAAGHTLNLEDQVAATLTGWPTPIVNDGGGSTHCYGKKQADGSRTIHLKLPGAVKLSSAQTESGAAYRLNPRFSLWLMGFGEDWASCAPQETRSSPKSARNS
jgi:hypothetical protein